MARVEQRESVRCGVIELEIVFRFFALPNPVGAASDMVVIVILVEEGCNAREVDYRVPALFSRLNQPLVEPQTADAKTRNVRICLFGKHENINTRMARWDAAFAAASLKGFLPARLE